MNKVKRIDSSTLFYNGYYIHLNDTVRVGYTDRYRVSLGESYPSSKSAIYSTDTLRKAKNYIDIKLNS